LHKLVAEAIGTFGLVFAGTGAVIINAETGGAVGHVGIGLTFPTLNLTTTGARSGQPRTATVVYFTDGDDVILVASSFGRAKNPVWFLNVIASPDVELTAAGVTGFYRARLVEGPERARLYELARRNYAGYGNYEALAGNREIPVLALRPL